MKYTTPEMELVMFETEEVIVASTVSEESSSLPVAGEEGIV